MRKLVGFVFGVVVGAAAFGWQKKLDHEHEERQREIRKAMHEKAAKDKEQS